MRRAAIALALVCMSGASRADNAMQSSVPTVTDQAPGAGLAQWFEEISGKKLVSVDGSTITLSPADGGLALEMVSPAGNARDLVFTFAGDGIGTISDGGPKAVGVFHQIGNGVAAEFADGHSEMFTVNQAGGISMSLSAPASGSYCMRWYPDGHVFGAADRKAALAAYASKLGLGDAVAQKSASSANCADVSSGVRPHRGRMQKNDAAMDEEASVQPVSVRTSQVHLIDDDPLPQPAASQFVAQPVQPVAPPAAMPAVQTPPLAAQPRLASTPPDKSGEQIRGASACLSIDSDGANWGFRNTCAYAVQFAYCLENGNDKSTACGSGAGSGNLAANGFVSLLANSAIVAADEEFRWIACAGGAAAHLDRPDPPAGRCVRVNGS